MPIFATKDILIDSLRSAIEQKDEMILALMEDIVELKRKVTITNEALELVDRWLDRERKRLTPGRQ